MQLINVRHLSTITAQINLNNWHSQSGAINSNHESMCSNSIQNSTY